MQKRAVLVEHEKVRIARDFWVLTQEIRIVVLVTLVDFHNQKAAIKFRANFLIGVDELVQNLAPASPVSANFQNDSSIAGLGLLDRRQQISIGATRGIVITNAVERHGFGTGRLRRNVGRRNIIGSGATQDRGGEKRQDNKIMLHRTGSRNVI